MAYREYKCTFCGNIAYAFEDEERKIRHSCSCELVFGRGVWEKMPPNPVVIHTTECFMSEAMLDSMDTAMELDRILTREKSHERELKTVELARRDL